MTPSKRRILAPKKLSSQTCANYFLILETSFKVCGKNNSPVLCGSEIKCGLMLSEKGCRGLAANLTSKPRRFKAFWRTNLSCSALIVIISCPTILLCKACLESGRAKQGRCFRNFLPCPQPVHLLCIHCWVEPSLLLPQSFPFYRTQVSLVRSLCPDVRPSVSDVV